VVNTEQAPAKINNFMAKDSRLLSLQSIHLMSRKNILILLICTLLSLGIYLLACLFLFRLGFPLDDAWIHQTYARNLAQLGEWAFIPGQPSGGSTGPLWSMLLSLGYILRVGPYPWTYFLGGLSLFFMGVIGYWVFPSLCPQRKTWALAAGIGLIFEWHLVWAAASGMETLAFSVVGTLVLALLLISLKRIETTHRQRNWVSLSMGLLIGLSVWLRPDGITLLAPAILSILLMPDNWKFRLRRVFLLSLGFVLVFGPYLIFNVHWLGSWWPTTFYAKQAEYSFLQRIPFWRRFLQQAALPLVGAGALLLPGFLLTLVDAARKLRWGELLVSAWILGYLLMYAWRLPVTYQHGRYVIPMMPIYFLLSFAGLARFVQLQNRNVSIRIASRVWLLTTTCLWVIFWIMGGRAFARDVSVIESEMVKIADWVKSNTPEDALIATHDIGAIGYFSERQLLDLAGLISPEVIPYLWDENHLEEYLNLRGADYLVTFPGWYPVLVTRANLLFQTHTSYSPDLGGENMAVYKWDHP
jgi:hypothetical protein